VCEGELYVSKLCVYVGLCFLRWVVCASGLCMQVSGVSMWVVCVGELCVRHAVGSSDLSPGF
jgi:hypothetical protein